MSGTAAAEAFRPDNRNGLILYDFAASPCARRVRITLLEKDLAWDTQIVDLARLEQRDPAYLAINPNGFVPTLAHGERVVYESNVITEYLDDVFPGRPLYPSDPWERAQVKMWQALELAMAKDHRPLMYQRVMGPLLRLTHTLDEALAIARRSTDDPMDLAWEERVWRMSVLTPEEEREYEERLWAWLAMLERRLEGRTYLVGNRFSQAEVSVYPRVAMLPFVQIHADPRRHPNVCAWSERLAARPTFVQTMSREDRALTQLARTPVLPWLRRTLHRGDDDRGLVDAVLLRLAREVVTRARGGGDAHAPAAPAAIRRPRRGAIPPGDAVTRGLRGAPISIRSHPITLYDYEHSPHARRLRLAMAELGLGWETERVDMGRMAHKAPEYLMLNPAGEVPTIRHGERLLYDSQVIAEYLDGLYGDPGGTRLYPRAAWSLAQVRMWIALEAGTHKELRPLWWMHVVRPTLVAEGIDVDVAASVVPSGVHPSYVSWLRDVLAGVPRFDASPELARRRILQKLDVLERRLAKAEWLVGEQFTMADLAWFTRCEMLPAIGVLLDASRHGHVARWFERVAARPAVSGGLVPAADVTP